MWSNFGIEKIRLIVKTFLLAFCSLSNFGMEAVVQTLLITWGTKFFALFFDFSAWWLTFRFCFSSSLRLFFGALLASNQKVMCSAGSAGGSDVFGIAGGACALDHLNMFISVWVPQWRWQLVAHLVVTAKRASHQSKRGSRRLHGYGPFGELFA